MSVKFKLNSRGMAELLKGSVAEKACKPRAEKVLAAAKASAPVATGAYRDSLHLVEADHPSRKVWQVVADVPYAMVVEADTGNLGRSLDSAR